MQSLNPILIHLIVPILQKYPNPTQDPDYPARELHFHTPQTRGWQCARFSKFPQELVLRLAHPARVHQIQLLSHEYKIATKIELFTGLYVPRVSQIRRHNVYRPSLSASQP